MKKILLALMVLFIGANFAQADEVDSNSIFGAGSVNLRSHSRYTITCPSIIDNVNQGDRNNIKFYFLDSEPFKYKLRAANTLVIKTFDPSSSYFEVFTHDGNSTSVRYNIKNNIKKTASIANVCRIEP